LRSVEYIFKDLPALFSSPVPEDRFPGSPSDYLLTSLASPVQNSLCRLGSCHSYPVQTVKNMLFKKLMSCLMVLIITFTLLQIFLSKMSQVVFHTW